VDIFASIAVASGLFVATNVDDLLILGILFADCTLRRSDVVVGQFLGIGTLIGVSVVAALASLAFPPEWIALLGLVPLALGVKGLFDLRKGESDEEAPRANAGSAIFSVAAVTIANGGDNLGVYIPYFASIGLLKTTIVACVFLALTGLWCVLALLLLRHRRIAGFVERFGHILLPFVLIGLGIWILAGALPLFSN
jgi:cadmium resistance protein CadD (predicted permease)